MSDKDNQLALQQAFAHWFAQIKRLVITSAQNVKRASNTLHVNTFSLLDLTTIIQKEVKVHEDNTKNPHGDTLTSMQGMTKAAFDAQTPLYFPKDTIPLTQVPLLSATVSGNKVSIAASSVLYRGRTIALPAAVLTASSAARQYVKVNIAGNSPTWAASLALSDTQTESGNVIIVGTVNLANGAYTSALERVVRIGSAAVRTTPRGGSIPASSGTQAAPGTINAGWTS